MVKTLPKLIARKMPPVKPTLDFRVAVGSSASARVGLAMLPPALRPNWTPAAAGWGRTRSPAKAAITSAVISLFILPPHSYPFWQAGAVFANTLREDCPGDNRAPRGGRERPVSHRPAGGCRTGRAKG